MTQFFLNYGGPVLYLVYPLKGFVGILAIGIFISITESIAVYLYLKNKTTTITFKESVRRIGIINILTTLLGTPLIWLSPVIPLVPVIMGGCFIVSVGVEQAAFVWLHQRSDQKFQEIDDHLSPHFFDAIFLANIVSYTVLFVSVLFSTSGVRNRLMSEYLGEVYLGIGFGIMGALSLVYLRPSSSQWLRKRIYLPITVSIVIIGFYSYYWAGNVRSAPTFYLLYLAGFLALVTLIEGIYVFYIVFRLHLETKLQQRLTLTRTLDFIKRVVFLQRERLYRIVMTTYGIIGVFLFVLILSVSLPAVTYDWDYSTYRSTLIVRLEEAPRDSLDLRQFTNITQHRFHQQIITQQIYGYLGFQAPGQTQVILPGIAEEWIQETPDSFTFTLRKDVAFHNGQPIRARDVEYSWKVGMVLSNQLENLSDPAWANNWQFEYPAPDPSGFGRIFTIHNVVSSFNHSQFVNDFSGGNPCYLLQPENSSYLPLSTEGMFCPISCGPYKFVEYQENEYVRLERFDEWYGWGKTLVGSNGSTYTFPRFYEGLKHIKYRIIEDYPLALVELRTGSVDLIYVTNSSLVNSSLQEMMNTTGFTGYQQTLEAGYYPDLNFLIMVFTDRINNVVMSERGTIHFAYSFK